MSWPLRRWLLQCRLCGVATVLVAAVLVAGCGPLEGTAQQEPERRALDSLALDSLALERLTSQVDGARLLAEVERYVALGPRHPGAPDRPHAIETLRQDLAAPGVTVVRQPFEPQGETADLDGTLTNLLARLAPEAPRRLLLGTHWDTRSLADEEQDPALRQQPVPGANDGTSGVVVLVEVLQRLARAPESLGDLGIDVVLFDGEEFGTVENPEGYCQGSKHFADTLEPFYPDALPVAAVVVDMVGDRDLELRREAQSLRHAPELTHFLWTLGRDRFPEIFADADTGPILDDHVPLLEQGIPATLLIDLDYPPWHTVRDTPDQVSGENLAKVTRHLLEVVLVLAASPELDRRFGDAG